MRGSVPGCDPVSDPFRVRLRVCLRRRGDRGQSAYGARPPLGFYLAAIMFLVIPEI